MCDMSKRVIYGMAAALLSVTFSLGTAAKALSASAYGSETLIYSPSSDIGLGSYHGSPRTIYMGISTTLQNVRKDNDDEAPVLKGGTVKFLKNEASSTQQLSAVFKASDGHVIVVDGGLREDAEHLLRTIAELGGHVDSWLITHPHSDHAGGLTAILESASIDAATGQTVVSYGDSLITVDDYYYSLFDGSWYEINDPNEYGSVKGLCNALLKVPHYRKYDGLSAGTTISLSEHLSFKIVNEAMSIPGSYAGNAAGIIYDIDIEGMHFLMLGDMSAEGGDRILRAGLLDRISYDYVQMAHHGQGGVDWSFYEALSPKYCIWPTNAYIFYADESSPILATASTRACISSLSSVRANYVTVDGDVMIR